MNHKELNLIPKQLKQGLITVKEAVNQTGTFLMENYPMFGLHRYDDDFRSDIIVAFLERGEHLLELYNPEMGEYLTFLFSYINTLINSRVKYLAKYSIHQKVTQEEALRMLDEKEIRYQNINYKSLYSPKIPYSYNKVPAEELRNALKDISEGHLDKKLLVLALKSSFYITDPQIEKVCSFYKIEKKIFYELIEFCKSSVTRKEFRRNQFQERRNYAYYHHKRYRRLLEKLKEDDKNDNSILISQLIEKEIRYKKKWKNLNKSFESGLLNLRPTNKTIAKLLGICERQVTYCLSCARKEIERNKNAGQHG